LSIFDEDFSGDSIGSFPTGWVSLGLGGSVIAGPDYFTGKAFQPAPSGGMKKGPDQGTGGSFTNCTTYFAYKYDQNVGPGGLIFSLYNAVLLSLGGGQTAVFSLFVESDRTITADAPGVFLGNSQWPISDSNWNFFQVVIQFGSINVSGTVFLTVQCDVIINGRDRISVAPTTTNAIVSSLPTGGADCEQWQFQSQVTGNIFSNITANSTVDAIPTYPHPGTPVGKVSQAVLEPIIFPTNAFGRVSQSAIEVNILPTTANMIISQMVIELLLSNVNLGGGWRIYEA